MTAVTPTQGNAAPSASSIDGGRRVTNSTGTGTNSANVPSGRANGSMNPSTGSPGAQPLTPAPTAATSPLKSLPMVRGRPPLTRRRKLPVAIFQSTGLRLALRTRTSSSPGAGSGTATSSTRGIVAGAAAW